MSLELCVADAGHKGRGVFTPRGMPAGTVVITFVGKEDWIWNIPQEDWQNTLQVGYDRYILPERGSSAWFLNHSCDPNCVLGGRAEVRTWRDVAKGEELTMDYSTNVGWDQFEMACRCDSGNCRGVIKSYGFLSSDLKEKYGRDVSPYLLEKRV